MAGLWYVRPDESFMFGSCTGTVDADYNASWLVDGRATRPVRLASGGLSLTATALSARTVSLVAIVNHNIAGTVGITGGVTATIPAATLEKSGIYRNSFVSITPVSATSLVMAAAGTPAIVGELIAGTKRELKRQLLSGPEFTPPEIAEWEGEASSLPPYDPGVAVRRLSGETILNDNGLQEVHDWHASTGGGSRPTLIVPVSTVNDPWLVTFSYQWRSVFQFDAAPSQSLHRVSFEFVEVPRVRW